MTVQINITVSANDGEFNAYEQSILDVVAGRAVGLSNVATPVAASTEEAKAAIQEQADKQEAKEVAALEAEAPKRKRRTRAQIEADKKAEEEAKAAAEAEEDPEEDEETPAEPEADEPQQDEEPDADDDEEDSDEDDSDEDDSDDEEALLQKAVEVTGKLVSQRKQAVVKAALKDLGAKRVTELKGGQVAAYLKAVDA